MLNARREQLVGERANRRRLIRKLIREFRDSGRNPFPNWKDSVQLAVERAQIVDSTGALLPGLQVRNSPSDYN